MIVGRSKKIEGSYIDAEGKSMSTRGGMVVLAGNENWNGVGHNAVVSFDGRNYLVFHGYGASDNGRSKLLIKEISWDKKDWPVVTLE